MEIDETDPPKKSTKKSKYFSNDDSDDDAGASSVAEEEDDDEQERASTGSGSVSRLVIRTDKLPSTTPKGPNGTWTCEEPGCGHVVRAADDKEGQTLIHAHFEEHEQEARDESEAAALKRVNLAKQEAGRNMPIEYVLPFFIFSSVRNKLSLPFRPFVSFQFFITRLRGPTMLSPMQITCNSAIYSASIPKHK